MLMVFLIDRTISRPSAVKCSLFKINLYTLSQLVNELYFLVFKGNELK